MATAAHEEHHFVEVVGLTPRGVGLFRMITRNDPRMQVAIKSHGNFGAVSLDSLDVMYDDGRVVTARVRRRRYPEPHNLETTRFALRRLAAESGSLEILVCIGGITRFLRVEELMQGGYLAKGEGTSFSYMRAESFIEEAPAVPAESAPNSSGTFIMRRGRLTLVG